MDIKSFLIGALLVAVVAIGYFGHDSQKSTAKVDVPGAKATSDLASAVPAGPARFTFCQSAVFGRRFAVSAASDIS